VSELASGAEAPGPVLVVTCRCGAQIVESCELGDILAAAASFVAKGWGYDERGTMQCPQCMQRDEGEGDG
jgi:hypothetical protein